MRSACIKYRNVEDIVVTILLVLLFASPVFAQSNWCGIQACVKFTAANQAEAELALAQSQGWIKYDFQTQADLILGPYAYGETFKTNTPSHFNQWVIISQRIDIPNKQGGWYADPWFPKQTLYEGNIIKAGSSSGFRTLSNSWIGDGVAGGNYWNILYGNGIYIAAPEPPAFVLYLTAVGMLGLTRLRRC